MNAQILLSDMSLIFVVFRTYGVVVIMLDFHRSDWGSNPSHGGKIS